MFGFNRSRRRARSGGALSSTNLRKAALAGVGLLAVQWWRKRQTSGRDAADASREPAGGSAPGGTF
jgi:hypothetical protein